MQGLQGKSSQNALLLGELLAVFGISVPLGARAAPVSAGTHLDGNSEAPQNES